MGGCRTTFSPAGRDVRTVLPCGATASKETPDPGGKSSEIQLRRTTLRSPMFRQTLVLAPFIAVAACGYPATASFSSGAAIQSFTASPATITAGQTTALAASFSNGAGSIDQGIGPIGTGAAVTVSPTATTTYTLTVTDAQAHSVSRTAPGVVSAAGLYAVVTIT